jgi:hypothetical protein
VRAAHHVRNLEYSGPTVSGLDFFGLNYPTVRYLLQQLRGADCLSRYVWKDIVEESVVQATRLSIVTAPQGTVRDRSLSSPAMLAGFGHFRSRSDEAVESWRSAYGPHRAAASRTHCNSTMEPIAQSDSETKRSINEDDGAREAKRPRLT